MLPRNKARRTSSWGPAKWQIRKDQLRNVTRAILDMADQHDARVIVLGLNLRTDVPLIPLGGVIVSHKLHMTRGLSWWSRITRPPRRRPSGRVRNGRTRGWLTRRRPGARARLSSPVTSWRWATGPGRLLLSGRATVRGFAGQRQVALVLLGRVQAQYGMQAVQQGPQLSDIGVVGRARCRSR